MKKRHVIATFALSTLLGVGIFAGAQNWKTREAKADGTTTLYCKMTYDWWKADGAAIGVHYWGGASATEWPGVRGESVSGDVDVWKFEVPSDSTKLIFVRVNGAGDIANWGAKTADLDMPTGTNNLYTITSDTAVWGDPGVAGAWSHYDEPAPVVVNYTMKVNGGEAIELEKNGATTEYCLHEARAFAANDVLTFYADGVEQDVAVKPDGGIYTNNAKLVGEDIKVDKAATANLYWDVTAGNVWVQGYPDPVNNNAYLVGTFNSWGGTRTGAALNEGIYFFENIELHKDDELKAYKFNAAGETDADKQAWIDVESSQGKKDYDGENTGYTFNKVGDNIVIGKDGRYDIEVNPTTGAYTFTALEYDEPAEEGYYICGVSGWSYGSALKMTNTEQDGNVAYYMGLEIAADTEIRVRSYYTDRRPFDQWSNVGNDGSDEDHPEVAFGGKVGDNFRFTTAGSYDVYATYKHGGFEFFIAEHVQTFTITMTGVLFNGKVETGTAALQDQLAYATADFVGEQPVRAGYVARGIFTDEHCTEAYVPKTFDAAGHLYVKYTKVGMYMVGDAKFAGEGLAWNIDGATILPDAINDTENNLYEGVIVISGASVLEQVEVRPVYYTALGVLEYPEYTLGTSYEEAVRVGDNIHFKADGTYAIYFNKSNQIWINKGADAFYTKFLTEVGGICDEDGETNLTNLTSVWSAQVGAYNSLSKDEKDVIKAVTFNGGDEHGDDLHKVIAKYHYIVMKYGTNVAEDFIWGQEYAPTSNGMNSIEMDETAATIIVVISVATIISAAGLFLVLKRKKHAK